MRLLVALILGVLIPLAAPAQTRVTSNDLSQLLQAVLDHPALAPFYHPDAPKRVPLRIAGVVPHGASLQKFGKPVEIVASPVDDAVLIIRELTVDGAKAEVLLVYPVEGVSGRFTLTSSNGLWKVGSANVLEH